MKKKRQRRSNISSNKGKREYTRLSKKRGQVFYLLLGYYHPVFASYFQELGERVYELRDLATKSAVRTFLSILNPPEEFSNLESIHILLSLKKALEDRIAAIVSKHSIYYWIHLYRRLAPENTFEHESLVSVGLYRETMETAFVKYGRLAIGSDLVMGTNIDPKEIMSGEAKRILKEEFGMIFNPPPGNVYIREFSISHFLELLSLERLASEFCHVAACLRRAYKGGRLIIENAETYHVLNDGITETLIQSIDERNERFRITATTRGIPIGQPDYDYTKMGAVCMLPRYNVERETLDEYPQDYIWHLEVSDLLQPRNDLAPNFLFMPIDISAYYSRHQFLSKVFAREYGFSLECFVQCIMALFYLAIYKSVRTRGLVGWELMQRAYVHYKSLQSLAKEIHSTIISTAKYNSIPQIGTYQPSVDEIRTFLKAFTLNTAQRHKIDLVVRGPRPLASETWPGNYLIDYSALPNILFSALNLEHAEWGEKGAVFEDYTIEKLAVNGFKLWERRKVMKAHDGTQKQIDVSFLLGTAMFVCECRSIGMSRAYERGEKEALKFRREKFESALKDCDDLAEWLSKHKWGANFEVPQAINVIIPVVVSPFVEYIWSADEALWLTREIPRVCTPDELGSITDRHILSEVVDKAFVRYVV